MTFPALIQNVAELNEVLSRPTAEVVESIKKLDGDFMLLGAGGKMGPSLAELTQRAVAAAGMKKKIIAVSRFSNQTERQRLQSIGIETVSGNLLDANALQNLPEVENVIYMAGMKFGSTDKAAETWAINTYLPGMVAQKFKSSRIVLFSTGNVYPLTPVRLGGCTEDDPVNPIGEYAQSALGRERIFEYFSRELEIPGVIIRLNYAIDLRYGILLDVAQKVFQRRPIDLTMGYVNVIWQGEANAVVLRAFELCETPPAILNVTGPETVSIRELAKKFGEIFQTEPRFENFEAETALLSNASRCHRLFGPSTVSLAQMIAWVAHWVKISGPTLAKPTHYETRDGKF
ncbi:MAG: NAD-dependent epimerase/dehydratase family protein [candidate division KSB1 bacterium]|nr:NAD-dependent epimerase/dehydratase family protein [candidate division KSB1 bacterium]MDZ7367979.1 NAD-dependent epimerase/dehydratase family protein [candidate division KSB1 bacterium]MDZ7405602.1 NAD-dependent epimerase/dehydratase family protein [candidate division KSB1 bacterium]